MKERDRGRVKEPERFNPYRARRLDCINDFGGHAYHLFSRYCTRCGWIDYPKFDLEKG